MAVDMYFQVSVCSLFLTRRALVVARTEWLVKKAEGRISQGCAKIRNHENRSAKELKDHKYARMNEK